LPSTLRLDESAQQRRVLHAQRLLMTIDYSGTPTQRQLHVSVPSENLELDISPLPTSATEP
jgi:hypothetical protein